MLYLLLSFPYLLRTPAEESLTGGKGGRGDARSSCSSAMLVGAQEHGPVLT